jgi:Uma2 family endonuclease
MQRQPVILTYEDYLLLPDDGRRYEIHEGELSVTPAPNPEHQDAIGSLYLLLRPHVLSRGLGKVYFAPFDVILDDSTIVQPDLVYFDPSRVERISKRGSEGAPTLVVEVLSPSTIRIDRVRKLQLYARFGVPYYWIVDSEARTIEAYHLAGDRYELVARLEADQTNALPPFPELTLDPRQIWD